MQVAEHNNSERKVSHRNIAICRGCSVVTLLHFLIHDKVCQQYANSMNLLYFLSKTVAQGYKEEHIENCWSSRISSSTSEIGGILKACQAFLEPLNGIFESLGQLEPFKKNYA